LVFMQYDQNPEGVLTPLPSKNIDTGLGLNRMAAILQDVPSVFETDQFAPLMALGEELSGRSRDQDFPTTRALRILADHTRAATCPPTRTAATSCAGCCAARSSRGGRWAWSRASCRATRRWCAT